MVCSLVAIAGLAGVGAGIALTGDQSGPPSRISRTASDRQVAQQITLTRRDLPADWSVDRSPDGPLSGLLSTGNSTLTPAEQQESEAVSTQYEGCMGLPASQDRIFGTAGAPPTAQAASPAFAGPGRAGTVEAGSTVAVFAQPSTVAADQAQIASAPFPRCFGTALGQLLTARLAHRATSSFQVGSPRVQALALHQRAGVQSVGLRAVIRSSTRGPAAGSSSAWCWSTVAGPRPTLLTFASPGSFPAPLTTTLADTLEANVTCLTAPATACQGPGRRSAQARAARRWRTWRTTSAACNMPA